MPLRKLTGGQKEIRKMEEVLASGHTALKEEPL